MKKTVLSVLIVFVVSTAGVFAQTTTSKTTAKKPCYVDANHNNVCDQYENHVCKNSKGTGNTDCKNKRVVSTTPTPASEQPQKSATQKPATK